MAAITSLYSHHLLQADRWPFGGMPKRLSPGQSPGNTLTFTFFPSRKAKEACDFWKKLLYAPKFLPFSVT